MKTGDYLIRLATLVMGLGGVMTAQDGGGISRQQADSILSELRQIRGLLEKQGSPNAPAPAAKSKLKIDGGYSLGSKDAPLTMVEFADYECGFCRKFQATTFEEIRKQYIDTGKLRFVSRNMPLDFHASAKGAAEAALCARDQGQFWKMHAVLYSGESKLTKPDLLAHAKVLNLDMPSFQSCLDSGKHKAEIAKDIQDASLLGITGTPSFFVGRTTPDGVEGSVVIGALPFATFDAKLKESETAK